jgi:hypothetical protein
MPPAERLVASFAAEPPQDPLPYGRWAETLREQFLAACLRVDTEGEAVGEPGPPVWYPDRTWNGRTYVPATLSTEAGWEYFGHVSYVPARGEGGEPTDFAAVADLTSETAEQNPDWTLDLSDDVVGTWRGEQGNVAKMTLVWGVPLQGGGAVVTGELANLAVDQCPLVEGRFTLLAPDDYRQDFLEVKLWSARGQELARESLYVEDDDGEDEPAEEPGPAGSPG